MRLIWASLSSSTRCLLCFRTSKSGEVLRRLDTVFSEHSSTEQFPWKFWTLFSHRFPRCSNIDTWPIPAAYTRRIPIRVHHFLGKSSGSSCPLRYRRTSGHQFRALSFHSHFGFNFVHQPFCSAPIALFSTRLILLFILFSARFTLFMFSSHLCSSVIRIVNATFCIVSRSLVEIGSVRDDGD